MLTIDDFTGQVNLPALHGGSPSNEAERLNFSEFLTEYETQFFELVFGYDYYVDTAESELTSPTTAYWTKVKADIETPLKRYVYYMYVTQHGTITTPTGEVQIKYEVAEAVVNKSKLLEQWNRMSVEVSRIYEYMSDNISQFDGFIFSDTFLSSGVHPLSQISTFQ